MADQAPIRVALTGVGGFVGGHLITHLMSSFAGRITLLATSKSALWHPAIGPIQALDVTDADAVTAVIKEFSPTHLIHLAGLAFVPNANAGAAWNVHVNGTRTLAYSILQFQPRCVFINIGSGQVYGSTALNVDSLDEAMVLAPTNDYEATKAVADLLLGSLASQGLRSIRMRPFNHAGPGQAEHFVIPSFARQIALIEQGIQEPVVRVGNCDAIRDFLDVRDVVRAYVLAIEWADAITPGTILNLASGVPRRIGESLSKLLERSTVDIRVETDPSRLRPSEIPRYVGNATRAQKLIGWKPRIAFEQTLADVLEEQRKFARALAINVVV